MVTLLPFYKSINITSKMVIYIGLRFILSYSKWNIYIIDYDLVIHALNRSFLLWGAPILFSFYQIQILIYGV